MNTARFLVMLLAMLVTGCASDSVSGFVDGLDPQTAKQLDRVFSRASRAGRIPVAAIVVRRAGEKRYAHAFGRLAPEEDADFVTPDTVFDIASLTKPLAGVPAGLLLAQREDTTLFERAVILRLFQHSLGLDDTKHYPHLRGVESFFQKENVLHPQYRYANANFLFLTFRVKDRVPEALDQIREHYWNALGLTSATFHPQADAVWSGFDSNAQPLIGKPYDPVANELLSRGDSFTLHSGLFASANDVALFADSLLDPMHDEPELAALRDVLFGRAVAMQSAEDESRTILVSPGGVPCATQPPFAPEGAEAGRFFYQTGYTGCLLWVDVKTRTTLALLTNAAAVGSHDEWDEFSHHVVMIVLDDIRRGGGWEGE